MRILCQQNGTQRDKCNCELSTGTVSFQGSLSYRGVTVTPLSPLTGLQWPLTTTSALVFSKVLLKEMNREKKGDFKRRHYFGKI